MEYQHLSSLSSNESIDRKIRSRFKEVIWMNNANNSMELDWTLY